MNYRNLLLPLVVMLAAAYLLISQSRAISLVRERASLLRQQIAALADPISGAGILEKSIATRNQTSAKASINWRRIAEITGYDGSDGIFAKQELLRAKIRIQAMTPAELLATLAGIKELGLDVRSRMEIDGMLITALGEKDPEAALTYLATPANDSIGFSWGIINPILATWTKTDLPAAISWFDRMIAAGSFDSTALDEKNYRRIRVEAVLLAQLSISDPAGAARRLNAYSGEDRSIIFVALSQFDRYTAETTDEKELISRVILAKACLPAGAQAEIIAKTISPYSVAGDYEKIDRFLDRVDATPEERAASIAAAARERFGKLSREDHLTLEEVDRFRNWATIHSLEKIDEVTGGALAMVASNHRNGSDPREKIIELISHKQESSGNDEVLLGFIRNWPQWGDAEKARSLADKIRDPELRDQFLESLNSDPFAP